MNGPQGVVAKSAATTWRQNHYLELRLSSFRRRRHGPRVGLPPLRPLRARAGAAARAQLPPLQQPHPEHLRLHLQDATG